MKTQPSHTASTAAATDAAAQTAMATPTAITPPRVDPDRLYTVGEVAALARVTVRTLHHYDRIGLLAASQRSESGYRLYDYGDLERLRQIRLMRELRFSLDAIGEMLDGPAYDRRTALVAQRELLRERQERTDRIIRGVDRALTALEEETKMDATEMFDGLEEFDHTQYEDEARERWGHTDAYKESMRRTRGYGKSDWNTIKQEGDTIMAKLAELLAEGAQAAGRAAMNLAEQHRHHIDRWFYPCTHGMHCNLAEMYTADPRFEEYFEKRAKGLAAFVQDAIRANEARWRNRQ